MSRRVLAALLVSVLSAAPALGALCGMDCGAAVTRMEESHAVQAHHEDSHHEGSHDAESHPVGPHTGAEAPPGASADDAMPAPHDCHRSGTTDLEAIGAGPQSCTHLRFEPTPAKLTSADALPPFRVVAVVATAAELVEPTFVARMPASSLAQSSTPTGLVLPLRI